MNTLAPNSFAPRRTARPVAIFFIVLFTASHTLMAQLKWDARTIERTPDVTDAKVEATFGFVNAGPSAITIDHVKTSCGCTVAALQKTTYGPGERGNLVATFTIGERKGKQSVSIRVISEAGKGADDLTLGVTIPEAAKITPSVLIWGAKEEPVPKSIELQAMPGRTLRVVDATSKVPLLKLRVETIEEAAKYHVVVTPEKAGKPFFSPIQIAVLVDGKEKTLLAYARMGAGGVGMPSAIAASRASGKAADSMEVEPKALSWSRGGEAAAKIFTVRAPAGRPLKIRQVSCGNPTFQTSFEEGPGANEFQVTVKPLGLDELTSSLVTIEAQVGEDTGVRRVPVLIGHPPR